MLLTAQLSEEAQESRNKDYKKMLPSPCQEMLSNSTNYYTTIYFRFEKYAPLQPYIKNVKELDEKMNGLISNPEFYK